MNLRKARKLLFPILYGFIKRVAGQQTAAPLADSAYLRTNGTVGVMFSGAAPDAPPVVITPPSADWEFRPSIYYIRQFANTPGDGIPTLCRKVMRGGGASMITECLATGIENLQIEYGVDTTDDGQPNVFLTNPTLAEMQTVVSARVFLLARTTDIDTRYTNTKTYSISNAPDFVPGDSFHRRVFSTSRAKASTLPRLIQSWLGFERASCRTAVASNQISPEPPAA